MRGERFQELDGLRGLAALSVLLFHYLSRYDQMYTPRGDVPFGFPYGANGVALFFIISGFVIFMTLKRCKTASDFVVSRFSRLYPAYWAAALLTYAVGSVCPLPGQHYTTIQLILNATMLQGFMNVESIDGVYWSLNVELCFYAVMLGLFLSGMLHNTVRLCLVWLAAAQSTYWLSILGIDVPWKIQQVFILAYAELFVAGIVFYEIYADGINKTRAVLLVLCFFVHIIEHGAASIPPALVIFALVAIAVSGRAWFLGVRPLVWLGTISYALYLIHQMIGFTIIRMLTEYKFPSALSVPITIFIVLVLASTVTYLVEQPGMRYIRTKFERATSAPPTIHQPMQATGDLSTSRLYEAEGRQI